MVHWQEIAPSDVNLDALADFIHEKGRPVHINTLAQVIVRAKLEAAAGRRPYAPGAKYSVALIASEFLL